MDFLIDYFKPEIFSPKQVIETGKTLIKRKTKKQKKKPEMEQKKEMDIYASISRQAYKVDRRKKVRGYEYIEDESTKKRAVYYNPKTKHYIVAQRGTQIKDNEDLEDDISILKGDLSKTMRHKRELGWLRRFEKKHGEENITLTGHSLGANHSKLLAIETGLPMVGFSEGTAPTFQSLGEKFLTKGGNISNYKVAYDPISGLNPFSINVKPKEGFKNDPHSLDHFIDEEAEKEELKTNLDTGDFELLEKITE